MADFLNLTMYKNATVAKLKNRRIRVAAIDEDSNVIEIKKLVENGYADIPHSVHQKINERIVVTGIKVSNEAALALFNTLGCELKRKGLLD